MLEEVPVTVVPSVQFRVAHHLWSLYPTNLSKSLSYSGQRLTSFPPQIGMTMLSLVGSDTTLKRTFVSVYVGIRVLVLVIRDDVLHHCTAY